MVMLQRYAQTQRVQQRADPQLVLSNRVLQMSALELREAVLQELQDNPALEALEETSPGLKSLSADDLTQLAASRIGGPAHPLDESRFPGGFNTDREDEADPLAQLEAPKSLREHLLVQMSAVCPVRLLPVARYLVMNVDDDGYLRCPAEEVIRATGASPETVEQVVALLQTLDPTGVGARSLLECLQIQARSARAEGRGRAYVEAILEEHWKELTSGKWTLIARKLRTSPDEVEAAIQWIQRNLSPYPGQQHRSQRSGADGATQGIKPDVVARLEEDGALSLEFPAEELLTLQINPHYVRLSDLARSDPASFTETERRHLRDYVHRAQMFLKSLRDRASLLRQLAERLSCEQEAFLRSEQDEDLIPLTQCQLASFLQVHESTVSRTISDKYVQLPSGQIMPLRRLFGRAASYRALVAGVVASENPASPYSDQQISDILRRQGVILARRTVMKYPEELNILSSRQRIRPSYLSGRAAGKAC